MIVISYPVSGHRKRRRVAIISVGLGLRKRWLSNSLELSDRTVRLVVVTQG